MDGATWLSLSRKRLYVVFTSKEFAGGRAAGKRCSEMLKAGHCGADVGHVALCTCVRPGMEKKGLLYRAVQAVVAERQSQPRTRFGDISFPRDHPDVQAYILKQSRLKPFVTKARCSDDMQLSRRVTSDDALRLGNSL